MLSLPKPIHGDPGDEPTRARLKSRAAQIAKSRLGVSSSPYPVAYSWPARGSSYPDRAQPLYVEVLHLTRVGLDKLAPGRNVGSHQHVKDSVC